LESATNKHHQLATPTVTMSLNEYDDFASLSFRDTLGIEEISRFNLEFQLSLLSSIHHDMLGLDFYWDSVHCSYSEPKHSHDYVTILGCPVYFEQSKTEVIFRTDFLDKPLLKSNLITETMAKEMCDQMLIEQVNHTDLIQSIYDILNRDPLNMPSSENIAQSLAISPRTMRRKLESQGTTLRHIVDQVRKNLSIHFLRGTRMNIDEIAEQVGFSSAANFRTAFKRWINKTPSMYRPGR
jgi:AraC-like DNA-binding protein